jgi:hypothetical protein
MTMTTPIDPTALRAQLLRRALDGAILFVAFTGARGSPCAAVGRVAVVNETHLVLVLSSGGEAVVAIARVTRIDVLVGRSRGRGSRRSPAEGDDRREVEGVVDSHRANGGIE